MAEQTTGLLSPFLREQRLKAALPFVAGRVFDCGCGAGNLASHCDPGSYVGFDVDAQALDVARANHPAHTFVDAMPATGAFDAVVALAVIEHVPDPPAFLRQLARLLAPGGCIVLTTPHPSLRWAHELGAKFGIFSAEAAEEHEALLDRRSVDAAAREAGLVLRSARRFLFGANQLFVLAAGNTNRGGA